MRPIDADALVEAMTKFSDAMGEDMTHGIFYTHIAPTIDAEPVRHGKWIYSNDFHWYVASCNKCGYQRRTDIKAEGWNQWNYCPHCGARMDSE